MTLLVVPFPRKDEFAEAIVARSLVRNMLSWKRFDLLCRGPHYQELLYEIGMSESEFNRRHGIRTCLHPCHSVMWVGDRIAKLGFSPFYGFRVCEECVFKDLEDGCDPFFRRFHYIPALDWCIEHERPLVELAGDEALTMGPTTVMRRGTTAQVKRLSTGRRDWGQICGVLLNLVRPLSYEDSCALISDRVKGLFVGCDFSNHQKIWRRLEMKFGRDELGHISSCNYSWYSARSAMQGWRQLTLLLAALYDSSDQVARVLRQRKLLVGTLDEVRRERCVRQPGLLCPGSR